MGSFTVKIMVVFPIDYRRFLSMFHSSKSGIYGIRDICMVYIPFWLLNLIEFCFFFVSMGNMVWWGKKNPLWNFIPLSGAYPCRTAQFCGIAGKPGLVLDLFIMGFIGVPFWKYR